jgi:hypothetical protein
VFIYCQEISSAKLRAQDKQGQMHQILKKDEAINPNSFHIHRYSDVRFRLVEILEVGDNVLKTADLEEQTIGADLIYEIDPLFTTLEAVKGKDGKIERISSKMLKLKELKHKQGVLSYCSFCNRAISLMIWKEK